VGGSFRGGIIGLGGHGVFSSVVVPAATIAA